MTFFFFFWSAKRKRACEIDDRDFKINHLKKKINRIYEKKKLKEKEELRKMMKCQRLNLRCVNLELKKKINTYK